MFFQCRNSASSVALLLLTFIRAVAGDGGTIAAFQFPNAVGPRIFNYIDTQIIQWTSNFNTSYLYVWCQNSTEQVNRGVFSQLVPQSGSYAFRISDLDARRSIFPLICHPELVYNQTANQGTNGEPVTYLSTAGLPTTWPLSTSTSSTSSSTSTSTSTAATTTTSQPTTSSITSTPTTTPSSAASNETGSSSLSGGAIAGIVIGVLALISAICISAFLVFRWHKRHPTMQEGQPAARYTSPETQYIPSWPGKAAGENFAPNYVSSVSTPQEMSSMLSPQEMSAGNNWMRINYTP